MSASPADQAMTYASYAEHCLKMAELLPDRESRVIHREMAAEWLRLAGQAAGAGVAIRAQNADGRRAKRAVPIEQI